MGKINQHFAITRHKFYYKWLYLGWRPLPYHFPLYKNSHDFLHDNITNWVHKSLTHAEYITNDLYTYVNSSYINNIILNKFKDGDGTTYYELITRDAPDGIKYSYKNYVKIKENDLDFNDEHWLYAENWWDSRHRSFHLLSDHNLPHFDDSTNMPFMSEEQVEMIETKLDEIGQEVKKLYFKASTENITIL